MPPTPQSVYTAADIRAAEARAAEAFGVSADGLMERAARAALVALRRRWPSARRVAVVAGSGKNGGDGRVLARLAALDGIDTTVAPADGAAPIPADVDVIVDGVFGTGLDRVPRGAAAAAIDAMNAHPAPVLSLDLPSGLDADSGIARGAVVRAALTVTFIALKPGLVDADGPACAGELEIAPLDLPDRVFEGLTPVARVIPPGLAAASLGVRAVDSHKGRFGHVVVVGGRPGYAGAARLAAEAALRCGAGLVSVACAPGAGVVIQVGRPELMVHECASASTLDALIARATVVAVGPGLGTDGWADTMLAAASAHAKPMVVDADALNLIAAGAPPPADAVVTPHPGEAARLLGVEPADIQRERFASHRRLSQRMHAVVVLKGVRTLVGGRGRTPSVCVAGNPGLASGGTGDALTGVIAALRAQGLAAYDAACAGVQLHAEAADAAARSGGPRGMIASDLIEHLRRGANG